MLLGSADRLNGVISPRCLDRQVGAPRSVPFPRPALWRRSSA